MSGFHFVPEYIVGDDVGEVFSLYPDAKAVMKVKGGYRAYYDLKQFKKDGGKA